MVVFTKVTASLACFSALAAALPMQNQKHFSVEQVKHPHATTASKGSFAVQYANALKKYKIPVPSYVQAAAEASKKNSTNGPNAGGGGSGSVGTQPADGESLYITPVTVGDTNMNLDIDTGSADL